MASNWTNTGDSWRNRILSAILLLPGLVWAQPATPERVATDTGGGNAPGISLFELYRGGLFWWKGGAQSSEVVRREGTLAVRPTLGLGRVFLAGPATRYLGRGYNFQIDGADRDDLFVYYTANGFLRQKPLASEAADALNDDTRITVERFIPPFQLVREPVSAHGAVMLWRGELWYSDTKGANFYIQRPSSLAGLGWYTAPGGPVKRLAPTTVLAENGNRLKDALIVLTWDGLLYSFDLDPFNGSPVLLARNVRDFAIRQESTTRLRPGGLFTSIYTTAIYAAAPDLSVNRPTGRLYRISARDGSNSVAHDLHNPDLQITAVAADENRLYITVTPLNCGGPLGCLFDQTNSQVQSRDAPAFSGIIFAGDFGTIADKLATGGALEGANLRSDGRWLYWVTGDSVWRIPADAKPIERDFEAIGVEVVQTTQDLDNTTRLVANKPTGVRAYARVAKDTTGRNRYAPAATLRGFLDQQELPGSPLAPVFSPPVTPTADLATLRGSLTNSFFFDLPGDWVQRGRLRLQFTVNPRLGVPETGSTPLANNSATTPNLEVIRMGTPCLVLVPIHTDAPNYDPNAPDSGFADILARAQSMLPVDHFRFALKSDRLSRPVPKIKFKDVLGVPVPYPAIDYEPFDVSGGFDDALFWLKVYSTFEKNPAHCEDTHFVGAVHWMANTSKDGSTALGLATRPDTGVAENLVVKMEPPGWVSGNPVWMEPRGGETLAHELSHNYTVRHVDQTTSPLLCGGGRPDGAGSYPCDTCTIGIIKAANVKTELSDRHTQFGFDPLTWSVIGPTNAADLMTYRPSKWLSKHTLDLLFGRIPGFDAPPALSATAAGQPAVPDQVVLVTGTVDTALGAALLWQCYRLPADTFDPAKIARSLLAGPVEHDWRIRFVDAEGKVLNEYPLRWEKAEDGAPARTSFAQFLPDEPTAARMQIMKGQTLVTECVPSAQPPTVAIQSVQVDPDRQWLSMEWTAQDPDHDPLVFTLQYSPDDGASWQTLQVGYPDESYATSTRFLSGGERNRVRVIATDGFHATIAESESFAVPTHSPEVYLSGVTEGQQLTFGQSTLLHAAAYDAEDGSLDPVLIHWQLDGPQSRSANGSEFSLFDLSPGAYSLGLSVADSSNKTGSAAVHFQILPLSIPESSAPECDGECGDAAYDVAPALRLSLGNGQYATAKIIHANGTMYVCVSGLNYAADGQPPASVGILTDRKAGQGGDPQGADPTGFFVDEAGIPFQKAGPQKVTPQAGFAAYVSQGESSWSAEFCLTDAVLGGWNRQAPILLTHGFSAPGGNDSVWPQGAKLDQPDTWSGSSLGKTPAQSHRPPIAVAGSPRLQVVHEGDWVFLDGAGSYDPEGGNLAYTWTQVAGPAASLDDSTHVAPKFQVAGIGSETELRFQLVVNDGESDSSPAETTLTLIPARESTSAAAAAPSVRYDPAQGGLAFQLLWPGNPGDLCLVQASTNLVDWVDLGTATANYLNLIHFTEATVDQYGQRFYRATSADRGAPPDPRGALRFDGKDGNVEVPHRPALNAFPLTAMAWVRTDRNASQVDGIVSKYADASLNGYSLFLYAGHLRGWYFRENQQWVWDGALGMDGGFIADGQWHHIALVVDETGGRLVVDGETAATGSWTGAPGAPTTTVPLQFGLYDQYPTAWLGDLDEIVLWKSALTNDEIRQYSQRRITDTSDARLVGLWHFDEQDGVSTGDASPNGFTAALRNGVAWTHSEAPLN